MVGLWTQALTADFRRPTLRLQMVRFRSYLLAVSTEPCFFHIHEQRLVDVKKKCIFACSPFFAVCWNDVYVTIDVLGMMFMFLGMMFCYN